MRACTHVDSESCPGSFKCGFLLKILVYTGVMLWLGPEVGGKGEIPKIIDLNIHGFPYLQGLK